MTQAVAGNTDLSVLFEDDQLLVIDKPSGLLSQPGRTISDSVHQRVAAARPKASGPLLVHRLDMDTSGLILLAKNADTHRAMQQQFEHRQISKRYVAVLENKPLASGGQICLALLSDYPNRPRQMVCHHRGKQAATIWMRDQRHDCAVRLVPLTGRTHQLRIHLAHPQGLGIPIVGDNLYARGFSSGPPPPAASMSGKRLMLHAEWLRFTHPDSGKTLELTSSAPFLITQ